MAKASDSTSPKVSIIVPVYKVEQYLRRCLDSIIAQTFTDWECILIDDGSPDKSGAICDEYAECDGRFRVIHQENKGVSAARNAGLDAARGEWIGFVDSDDWIEGSYLESLFKCAIENKAEVVLCNMFFSDGRKHITKYHSENGLMNMPKDFAWFRQGPWAKLIHNLVLHKYNIRFPVGITLAEDLYFTFQVFFYTKNIFYIENPLYYYYQNIRSCTHTLTEHKLSDEIYVIKCIEKILIEQQASKEWFDYLIDKKKFTKYLCIYSFDKPRFDLWRETFPEVNNNFSNDSIKRKLFVRLILLHFDFICKLLLRIKK